MVQVDQRRAGLLGFRPCVSDPCAYVRVSRTGKPMLLGLFVDDLVPVYAKVDGAEWAELKSQLMARFAMKDLGKAEFVLGMKITRDRQARTLHLSHQAYVEKMLHQFSMEECAPQDTPEEIAKLSKADEAKTEDQRVAMQSVPYMELVGSLLYAPPRSASTSRMQSASSPFHAVAGTEALDRGQAMLEVLPRSQAPRHHLRTADRRRRATTKTRTRRDPELHRAAASAEYRALYPLRARRVLRRRLGGRPRRPPIDDRLRHPSLGRAGGLGKQETSHGRPTSRPRPSTWRCRPRCRSSSGPAPPHRVRIRTFAADEVLVGQPGRDLDLLGRVGTSLANQAHRRSPPLRPRVRRRRSDRGPVGASKEQLADVFTKGLNREVYKQLVRRSRQDSKQDE